MRANQFFFGIVFSAVASVVVNGGGHLNELFPESTSSSSSKMEYRSGFETASEGGTSRVRSGGFYHLPTFQECIEGSFETCYGAKWRCALYEIADGTCPTMIGYRRGLEGDESFGGSESHKGFGIHGQLCPCEGTFNYFLSKARKECQSGARMLTARNDNSGEAEEFFPFYSGGYRGNCSCENVRNDAIMDFCERVAQTTKKRSPFQASPPPDQECAAACVAYLSSCCDSTKCVIG